MNFFGSEKYFRNRTPEKSQDNINNILDQSNTSIFLRDENKEYLYKQLKVMGVELDDMIELHSSMVIFAKKFSINNLRIIGNDKNVLLNSINKKYIHYMSDKFAPFEAALSSQVNIGHQQKKHDELTADDMKNIDIYRPSHDRDLYMETIGMCAKRSRRNGLQKYMHSRHVETDLEGLQARETDRASLDNLVRGYDMSDFILNANSSKKPISRYQID
jgi:hypothetical protein